MRLSRFRPSVPIMADNREVRTIESICVRRNIRQVKEGIVFFSVLFTTFSRQTSIIRCVIMVDVLSCIFTISTFLREILTFLFTALELKENGRLGVIFYMEA